MAPSYTHSARRLARARFALFGFSLAALAASCHGSSPGDSDSSAGQGGSPAAGSAGSGASSGSPGGSAMGGASAGANSGDQAGQAGQGGEAGAAPSAGAGGDATTSTSAHTVSVVRPGANGKAAPLAGVAVYQNDPVTGALQAQHLTNARGVADFSDLTAERATISIVDPSAGATTRVLTFVDVPTSGDILVRLPGAAVVIAQIEVDLTGGGRPPGAWAEIPSGGGLLGKPKGITLTGADLQNDGTVTLVAIADNDGVSLDCGMLSDLPPPADNALLTTSLRGSPPDLAFTADSAVNVRVGAWQKGVFFAPDGISDQSNSGTASSCLELLPAADSFVVSARTLGDEQQTTVGADVVVARTAAQQFQTFSKPLPRSLAFTTSGISIPKLDYDGKRITFEAAATSGALAAAVAELTWSGTGGSFDWRLLADPSSAALTLPDLPNIPKPGVGAGATVEMDVALHDRYGSFAELWSAVRTRGSLDEVLLPPPGSTALTAIKSLKRTTPSYVVSLGGFDWERYGKVTSSGGHPDLDCGNFCTGDFTAGTTATLVATANPGATFSGWSGACSAFGTTPVATLSVVKNATCTPAFSPASGSTYTLQVAGGPAPVLIASDDGFIQCGQDSQGAHYSQCSHSYPSGYGVVLTETPAQASSAYSVQWSGGCSGTSSSTFVAMSTNRSCSVTLAPQ